MLVNFNFRRSSKCPPCRDIVDIASEAQELVESTVPRPTVSRNSSFTNLAKNSTVSDVVLDSDALTSSQKLIEFDGNVVSRTKKDPSHSELRPSAVYFHHVESDDEIETHEHIQKGLWCSLLKKRRFLELGHHRNGDQARPLDDPT